MFRASLLPKEEEEQASAFQWRIQPNVKQQPQRQREPEGTER